MRRLLLLPPLLWLLALVGLPLLLLAAIALGTAAEGVPPFVPPLAADLHWQGSLENFATLLADDYYLRALLRSLGVAGATGLCCLLLAYPMALGIAAARPARRLPLLLLVLLPFWTGFLLRIGAWVGLLRDGGWVNTLLLSAGIIEAPLPLLYSSLSLMLGMVHAYLPFAVLPLTAVLLRLDAQMLEAAADLGAPPLTRFLTITLPLTAPGAAAGFLLVFIPAAGEFVIPELLGPPEAQLIGRVLWGEFFQNRDWPMAAAVAVALLALLILPIRLFQRLEARP